MAKGKGTKLIAQNKKAYHDYFIEETIQAGISLAGKKSAHGEVQPEGKLHPD